LNQKGRRGIENGKGKENKLNKHMRERKQTREQILK
jgi:hypothetical protein